MINHTRLSVATVKQPVWEMNELGNKVSDRYSSEISKKTGSAITTGWRVREDQEAKAIQKYFNHLNIKVTPSRKC